MTIHPASRLAWHRAPNRQRGVVLLFSLIALVIMLIAAVALMRSFNSTLFQAGNIAFKRDMRNQSERAVEAALAAFGTGELSTEAGRSSNQSGANYSATMLATTPQGIPLALALDDSTFAAAYAVADVEPPNTGVRIRWVIDRLCDSAGSAATLGPAGNCVLADDPTPAGTSASNLQSAERLLGGPPAGGAVRVQSVAFRLSIKVTGPRNTQSFFQSTFSVPS